MQLASCQKAQRGGVTQGQDPQRWGCWGHGDAGQGERGPSSPPAASREREQEGNGRGTGGIRGFFTVSQCCCSRGGAAPAAAPTPPQSGQRGARRARGRGKGTAGSATPRLAPCTGPRFRGTSSPKCRGPRAGPWKEPPPGTKGTSPGCQRQGGNTGGFLLRVRPGGLWQGDSAHGSSTALRPAGRGVKAAPQGARFSFIGVWLHRGSPQARHGVVEHPPNTSTKPREGAHGHGRALPSTGSFVGVPPSPGIRGRGRGRPPLFPSPAPRPVRQEAMRQQSL